MSNIKNKSLFFYKKEFVLREVHIKWSSPVKTELVEDLWTS